MFGDIELVKKSCFLGWVLVEIALVVCAGGNRFVFCGGCWWLGEFVL